MVNKERLLQSFVKLVETDSPSMREGKVRDLLKAELSRRGIVSEEDRAAESLGGEAGNLLARIAGTLPGPPILFAAHMDTVEPARGVRAKVQDGVVASRGDTILGADDKAAVAAILEALDVLQEKGYSHPPLELLFTVGEEQGLKGAKAFDFGRLQSKIGYVLDAGGNPGTIVLQSPCQNEMEFRVKGKAAHAGINPEEGLNAIHVAAAALAMMPCGRIDEETTCNFGTITGGTARNIVADSCIIWGEARSLNRSKLEALTHRLVVGFQEEVGKKGGDAEVKVHFLYPEIQLDASEEVVQRALRAARHIGLQPRLTSTGGGSDASIINGAGIRCANLGIGMQKVHTTEEFIRIDDLVHDAQWVVAIILDQGGNTYTAEEHPE